jgi:flagellar biosynthetic protein FliO
MSRTCILFAVLALALVAVPAAGAATAAAAKDTTATSAKADKPSAAERRAADSKFEREKLDPNAFASDSKKSSSAKKSSGSGGSMFRMLFGLIVVLGAIYGIHWLLKKWGASRLQGVTGRTGVIDVVATTALAQGRSLHLVRVGEELVLVGATDQSITRIGEVNATALGATTANQGNGEFQAMLSGQMLGQQPGVPQGMGGAGSANDPFLKRFSDNLRLSTAR